MPRHERCRGALGGVRGRLSSRQAPVGWGQALQLHADALPHPLGLSPVFYRRMTMFSAVLSVVVIVAAAAGVLITDLMGQRVARGVVALAAALLVGVVAGPLVGILTFLAMGATIYLPHETGEPAVRPFAHLGLVAVTIASVAVGGVVAILFLTLPAPRALASQMTAGPLAVVVIVGVIGIAVTAVVSWRQDESERQLAHVAQAKRERHALQARRRSDRERARDVQRAAKKTK